MFKRLSKRFERDSCLRKKKLEYRYAIKVMFRARIRTGKKIMFYKCKFCEYYHLTSHFKFEDILNA